VREIEKGREGRREKRGRFLRVGVWQENKREMAG
jgi:hypothetical protein